MFLKWISLKPLKENKILAAMTTDSEIKMDHKVGEKKTLRQYWSLERSFIYIYIYRSLERS